MHIYGRKSIFRLYSFFFFGHLQFYLSIDLTIKKRLYIKTFPIQIMVVPWQNYLYTVGLYLLYIVIIVAPVKMLLRKKTALSEKKIEILDYSMSGFGLGFCLSFFIVNLPIYYALGWPV